jgi:hypothetical protein
MLARRIPLSRARRGLVLLAALVALLANVACESGGDGDGGGGGGSASAGPAPGSVAVVLTDGPVDPRAFEHIYVTYVAIVLIGEPGQVTIFEGRETVDLRDLEDVSKLVTVGREVPAGFYSKIRLEIEEIELVPADGSPPIKLSEAPNKLPPKIDLNPQEQFEVRPKKLLLVQIDIVAGESLHIVETGREDKYQFRPVVFVDILTGPVPGKLVLLEGTVRDVDDAEGTFDLCGSHPVSRPKGGDRETEYPDDVPEDEDDDHCVEIVTLDSGNKTSFFEDDGSPAAFDAVDDGDDASVLGRFRREEDDGEDLVFIAEVVQLGNPLALDGSAASVVGPDDRFLLDLDPGQPIASDDPLPVLLQQGSKVFTRRGLPLAPSKIEVDDPIRATGVFDRTDDELKAAFVMVDVMAADRDRIEGVIDEDPEDGGALLQVLTETDPDPVCVEVPEDAKVFRISVEEGEGSAEAIDRSELARGDRVNVFGEKGIEPDECFLAETVISFGDDATLAPLPALDGGGSGVVLQTAGAVPDEEETGEAGASVSAAGVEVYEVGPRRVEAGLIWVKLPGDEDPAEATR